MLGHDKFDFEWISLYKFQCRRMDKFLHGRVIFAGDAAHQVSPFGARGANSGLEDAENIAWKLDRVLRGVVAGSAAGELPHRAQRGGGREHPRIHPLDRFHGAGVAAGGAAAQGGAVAGQGNRIRQAHGQWRTAVGAFHLRHAAVDRRSRCVARRPAARRVDAGCADCGSERPADVSDRSLHRQGNAVHAAGVWQWCRDRCAGRRGNHSHRRRRRFCRYQGPCGRALRRRARHRLSAAARRLCRRALPASDPVRRWMPPSSAPPVSTEGLS